MGRIKLRRVVFSLLLVLPLFLFAGCENALLAFVFDTLFGPPYRHQVAKLAPSDANTGNFGQSVDISGDYIIVGAPNADGGAGAAYIFHRTGTDTWDAGVKLAAGDAAAGDLFGSSVSISADYVAVGAPGKNVGRISDGAIYIFTRTGANTWDSGTRQTLVDIVASPEDYDRFGFSVGIDGNWLAAGARQDDLGDVDTGKNYGAVYFFEYSLGAWGYKSRLDPGATLTKESANFGFAVDLNGNYLIVGAHYEDTDGDGAYPLKQGAAYIYRFVIDSWIYSDRITATDPASDAIFGAAVGISGDYAVAGSLWKSESSQDQAGAAYLFQRSGSDDWDSLTPLKQSTANPAAGDWYGSSVAVRGDYALVGAVYKDDFASNGGAAYLYNRTTGNTWELLATVSPDDAGAVTGFGMSAAFSNTYAVIGATDPLVIGGSGAVYIFR